MQDRTKLLATLFSLWNPCTQSSLLFCLFLCVLLQLSSLALDSRLASLHCSLYLNVHLHQASTSHPFPVVLLMCTAIKLSSLSSDPHTDGVTFTMDPRSLQELVKATEPRKAGSTLTSLVGHFLPCRRVGQMMSSQTQQTASV